MENQKNWNQNPEDRDSEARQAGTNRDNSIVNKPGNSAEESGTNSDRNDQYHAGGTDRLTGTSSVSDSRAAEGTRTDETAYGQGQNTNPDEEEESRNVMGSENQFDSENLDDESDDFLKGSGRDHGDESRSMRNNNLDPDFDRNSEI